MGRAADSRTALVLTGGGARGAYQIGVLQALVELLPANGGNPFPIICGASAGALNAAALAAFATDFRVGVERLADVWLNFRTEQVYRSDAASVLRGALRWLGALATGGLGRFNPLSLLDNRPLRELLTVRVPCARIVDAIEAGALHAVCVSASGYSSGQSVAFYEGVSDIPSWRRATRVGCPTRISIDHLMASSALPIIFPAVRLNREYFGDGAMRQSAPLSPALHLGANRLLVIGVRSAWAARPRRETFSKDYPSFGEIAGFVLNSLFLDGLHGDLERLERINETVDLIPGRRLRRKGVDLRSVQVLVISPSRPLDTIANRHQHRFPWPVRSLLRGVGALGRRGGGLTSYLLFEGPYCRELADLGYRDTMRRREEVKRFLAEC